jgi:hypothetical protein
VTSPLLAVTSFLSHLLFYSSRKKSLFADIINMFNLSSLEQNSEKLEQD